MKMRYLFPAIREQTIFRRKAIVIAPPLLTEPVRFPYGPFRFKMQLPKGTAYVILASTDLAHWTQISASIAGPERFEYVDSEAFKYSARFYRVVAGEVDSQNVIGYVSFTLPPGFSMIANPFEGASNRVGELFKGWPDGTKLSKFDTRLFKLAEGGVQNGQWSNASEKLEPGEGAIFCNQTLDYKAHSFVGNVSTGQLSVPIPAGFSVRSCLLPKQGSLDELGFPISEGDVIHIFDRDRQKYILHPYENGRWTDGTPMVGLGESFWVAKAKPGTWTSMFVIK